MNGASPRGGKRGQKTQANALFDPACEGKGDKGEGQGGIGWVKGTALSHEGRGGVEYVYWRRGLWRRSFLIVDVGEAP
jgi:hypothetical protein